MPNDWYKISQKADKNFSASQWIAINNEFVMMTMGRKKPDVALFANNDNSATRDYYFSPAAAALAQSLIARYAGTKCDSPIGVIEVSPVVSSVGWESVFLKPSK